jgi:hypothetical protein
MMSIGKEPRYRKSIDTVTAPIQEQGFTPGPCMVTR